MIRWLKFNAVGGMGIAVQLAALALLKSGLHVGYLPATAAAVELALLHNFIWHERWTWRDRGAGGRAGRLLRFHLANGLLSIAVNLALMRALVGRMHWPYLAANVAAIAAGSVINFFLGDLLVFRRARGRDATPACETGSAKPAFLRG
ncbi:MAG: GtrA family protein [Bryobacteraceae bacterium]